VTGFTIVEPTTLIRDWMRTLGLSVGQHIYAGGLPNPYSCVDDGPAVVLWAAGDGADDYTGQVDGHYQLDCLASTASVAAQLAGEVKTALTNVVPGTALSAHTALHGWFQIGGRADFDPDPLNQRYIVTAQATTITTP